MVIEHLKLDGRSFESDGGFDLWQNRGLIWSGQTEQGAGHRGGSTDLVLQGTQPNGNV